MKVLRFDCRSGPRGEDMYESESGPYVLYSRHAEIIPLATFGLACLKAVTSARRKVDTKTAIEYAGMLGLVVNPTRMLDDLSFELTAAARVLDEGAKA